MSNRTKSYVDIMATHPEVTGSGTFCVPYFLDGRKENFLVDCGLFQEERYEDYNLDFPFKAENINFVLLTHNHIDHIGRIPLLEKLGFNKDIYTTYATSRLMPHALYDTEKIIRKWAKRKKKNPIFDKYNVSDSLQLVHPCEFEKTYDVKEGIKVTFFKNAHLIGAAVILIQISYPEMEDINLLFTGDYNEKNTFFDVPPLPKWVTELNLTLVIESTYGYTDSFNIEKCFDQNIIEACKEEKAIIIPAFSLGRSQEVLYRLKCLQDNGEIPLDIPIYFDGNLAFKYTSIYLNDPKLGLKEHMKDFLPKNIKYVDYDTRNNLLNNYTKKIIVTTSGMGSFGPAQQYIPNYLKNRNTLIHFTGFTTEGSLGARLRDAKQGELVSASGIMVRKEAEVKFTQEFSSHAKADQLIAFLKQFNNLRFVLVNHGEVYSKELLSGRILDETSAKEVGILNRDYVFRVNQYGLVKTIPAKLR